MAPSLKIGFVFWAVVLLSKSRGNEHKPVLHMPYETQVATFKVGEHTLRYAIFKIDSAENNYTVMVESFGDPNKTYADFLKDIRKAGKNDCRYGLVDFEFPDCTSKSKPSFGEPVFVFWLPEAAPSKPLYANNTDKIVDELSSVKATEYFVMEDDKLEEKAVSDHLKASGIMPDC